MAPTEPGGGGPADRTTSSGHAGNTEAKPKSTMPPRSRRLHTRSRAGCITCRKRHVKCDEARPIWYVEANHGHAIGDLHSSCLVVRDTPLPMRLQHL
jgi:hypothetical protein